VLVGCRNVSGSCVYIELVDNWTVTENIGSCVYIELVDNKTVTENITQGMMENRYVLLIEVKFL
jgi:hypothetical protein